MANEELSARIGLETGGLSAGLASARQQLGKFKDGVKDVAKSARKDFKSAMGAISEESPAAGVAIKAFLNPIAGAFAGAVMIFRSVSAWLEKLNAQLDRMGADNAKPIGNMAVALKAAAKEARESAKAFDDWLASHKKTSEEVVIGLNKQIAALKSQTIIVENLLEKDKERAKLAVHQKVADGKMTAVQGAAEMAKIDKGFASAKGLTEYQSLAQEMAMRKKASATLKGTMDDSLMQAKSFERLDANFDRGHFKDRPAEIEDLKKHITELEKNREDITGEHPEDVEKFESIMAARARGEKILQAPRGYAAFETNANELNQARSTLGGLEKRQAFDTSYFATIQAGIAKHKAIYGTAASQYEANQGALTADQFRQREMISTMDPAEQRRVMQNSATADFTTKRQALVQAYQKNHNMAAWQSGIRGISTEYNSRMNEANKQVDPKHIQQTAESMKTLLEAAVDGKGGGIYIRTSDDSP